MVFGVLVYAELSVVTSKGFVLGSSLDPMNILFESVELINTEYPGHLDSPFVEGPESNPIWQRFEKVE
jgi:hypothetical protein